MTWSNYVYAPNDATQHADQRRSETYVDMQMPLVPSVSSTCWSPSTQFILSSLVFCVSRGGSYVVTRPSRGWLMRKPRGNWALMSGSPCESRQHTARDRWPWSYSSPTHQHSLIGWFMVLSPTRHTELSKVLRPTRYKIGHLGDVLPSQFLGSVPKN